MKVWHITSHNILLSGDGENTNSLQFNGVWIKFSEEGKTISVQAHKCSFLDTVTAKGTQGNIRSGETIRSDRKIEKVKGKLNIKSDNASKAENLINLGRVQALFPQGVSNFNNLIYNIKSYNRAHYEDGGNYYNDKKGMSKHLNNAFTLGTTGPFLGGVLSAAGSSYKIFSYLGISSEFFGLATDISFSNLHENLVSKATKKPVIIVDFSKENDSLKDSTGHVIRAFSQRIIEKHDANITEETVLLSMWHSVTDYLEGYMKRANSIK